MAAAPAVDADAALLRAAKAGDANAVREALRARASVACVNSNGATPLHVAMRYLKDTAIATELLAAGASLEARTLQGRQVRFPASRLLRASAWCR